MPWANPYSLASTEFYPFIFIFANFIGITTDCFLFIIWYVLKTKTKINTALVLESGSLGSVAGLLPDLWPVISPLGTGDAYL